MPPVKKSRKYLQLLKVGKELFWKYGIRRITVEELCEKAETSKMTFYRNFKNKTELAKAIMDQVFDDAVQKHRELMAQPVPFTEKIRQIVFMKREGSKDLSPEFVQEIYANDDLGLRPYFEQRRQEILAEVFESYRQAQKRGKIRQDFKIEMIPILPQKIQEIAMDPNVQAIYGNDMQALSVELTKLFFYGLAAPET